MASPGTQSGVIRFGPFEFDPVNRELRKDRIPVKLQPQQLAILALLAQRAGQIVSREEIHQHVWGSDTFVDFERGINFSINQIRAALGDSAESPHFIETLPRRGYRFIGEVEPPIPPVAAVAPDRGSHFRQTWLKIAAGVLAMSVVAVAAVVAYQWHRPQGPQEQAALTAVPFTALPGQATSPAFSPDGSRIAFAWNGDPAQVAKGFDLYVKAIGSETLLRLTQHPSGWISAAWSPDGTQIAFHRMAGADSGIYVVPALGGPERKLRSTRMPTSPYSLTGWSAYSIISWSPDSQWIAFSDLSPEEEDVTEIYLLSTETLEIERIPTSPKCDSEGGPAFSHNGAYLAYWCFRNANDEAELHSSSFPDGKPKMIASFRAYPNGLTWSADDKKLIYSSWNLSSNELGEVNATNGSTKQLAFAGTASQPAVSSKGNKLAYNSDSYSSNIWRSDLLHPESPAVELIASSRAQFDAQYSPDGKRIAFASLRSGMEGVWISSDNGSNLVQISNPAHASGSPQWSPDGNKIAFDSRPLDRWEIYVADVAERKPRQLVTNISSISRPHWSRDGKWIYFTSQEPGKTGVYRCPAAGGDAIALSKDIDGFSPQESFDGTTLYFASPEDESTLKKLTLPAQPGTKSEVDGLPRVSHSSLWILSPGGIYFVPAEAPRSVRYFDFATKRLRPLFEVDEDFGSGLSVSPDGRWILYSRLGDVNSDIMLVDHFH